jgi:hypothetical protein
MISRFVAVLLLALGAGARAQDVPRTALSKPDASFPEPFSSVIGLRELPDGRVVLADRLEQTVSILTLADGDIVPIGRQGQGPGEYGMPGPLYPFPGDSTLMVDFGALRAVLITGVRLGRTIPLTTGDGLPMIPRGADARGRLYGSLPAIARGTDAGGAADSAPITRLDAVTGRIDTAAWIRSGSRGSVTAVRRSGGGQMRLGGMQPYAAEDAWTVAPDGRVAIVHASDYHVEWIAADGKRTSGPPLAFTPVKIGRAEKEQWADRMSGGVAVVVMRSGGGNATSGSPPAFRPSRPNIDEQDWPEVKPPFVGGTPRTAPDGTLWIQVSQPASAKGELWDIVDARGQRIRQIVLPEGRRLVGLGNGTVYTVRRDADDLEWLERY